MCAMSMLLECEPGGSSRWPTGAANGFLPENDWYASLAEVLHEGFPAVKPQVVASLGVATQCVARSLIVADKIVDHDVTDEAPGDLVHGIIALQYKALRALNRIFADDDPFWQQYEGYYSDHLRGVHAERRFVANPWLAGVDTVSAAVRDRNRIHCGVMAALAALAEEPQRLPKLELAMDAFCTALQLMDDVHDWRVDIERRKPTNLNVQNNILVDVLSGDIDLKGASRRIFFDGAAENVASSAIEYARQAAGFAREEGLFRWAEFIGTRLLAFENFLERIVAARKSQVAWSRQIVATAPLPALAGASPIVNLLVNRLRSAWSTGFGELRHLMLFPSSAGFTGQDELKRGDLFQRLLVLDALIQVNSRFGPSPGLETLIDQESTLLLNAADVDPVLGRVWKYFPDLPELPADTDDLAEIIRLVNRVRERRELEAHIDASIRTNLETVFAGSQAPRLETWIVPSYSSEPVHLSQRRAIETAWGNGDDVEVVANLMDALYDYDLNLWQAHFSDSAEYFAGKQDAAGFWFSTWYVGPYYGTYAVARALGRLPESIVATFASKRALNAIIEAQCENGGWTLEGDQPDALSTSLALLALHCLRAHGDVSSAVAEGLDWLRSHIGDEPSTDFIKMHIPVSNQRERPREIRYGSKTLTLALMLRALLQWESP